MENDIKIVPLQCKKQGCTAELSEQERHECEAEKMVPLCSEHKEWFKNQMKQCAPLFQKMNVS